MNYEERFWNYEKRFIGICLQELEETLYWLERLSETDIFTKKRLADLTDETNQLIAIFTTISKNKKKGIPKN